MFPKSGTDTPGLLQVQKVRQPTAVWPVPWSNSGRDTQSFTHDGEAGSMSATLIKRARSAEEHGFNSFWVVGHFVQIPYTGRPEEPVVESWSTVSFITGATRKINVGCLTS